MRHARPGPGTRWFPDPVPSFVGSFIVTAAVVFAMAVFTTGPASEPGTPPGVATTGPVTPPASLPTAARTTRVPMPVLASGQATVAPVVVPRPRAVLTVKPHDDVPARARMPVARVRPGAFCSRPGAHGLYLYRGVLTVYTCKVSPTENRLRWRR